MDLSVERIARETRLELVILEAAEDLVLGLAGEDLGADGLGDGLDDALLADRVGADEDKDALLLGRLGVGERERGGIGVGLLLLRTGEPALHERLGPLARAIAAEPAPHRILVALDARADQVGAGVDDLLLRRELIARVAVCTFSRATPSRRTRRVEVDDVERLVLKRGVLEVDWTGAEVAGVEVCSISRAGTLAGAHRKMRGDLA